MEDLRDALVLETSLSIDDLVADYRYVRLGDLISLAFCTGWTDAQSFGGWTVQRLDDCVTVAPDPFGAAEIPIEIAARELQATSFRSDAELHEAIRRGGERTLRGTVVGGNE